MENAIARKLDPPVINPIEIESVLLNRLSSVGQKSYAEHMGISESTASRRKAEGHFSNMAKELAFLGIGLLHRKRYWYPENIWRQLKLSRI